MKPSYVLLAGCVFLSQASSQQRPAGIEAKIRQKPGAWETLKVVHSAPTPNDARNFGVALPK
jgi:hypothetical protein